MLMIVSCQEDEIVVEEATYHSHQEEKQGFISFEELTNNIGESAIFKNSKDYFDRNLDAPIAGRGAEFINAYIDTSEIHLIETETTNYFTLKLINNNLNERANTFYNLVFEQNLSSGEVTSSILQYEPELSWLFDRSQSFKGDIKKYTNTLITIEELNNGLGINDRTSIPMCTIASVGFDCSINGSHTSPADAGGTCGGQWYVDLVNAPCPQTGGGSGGSNSGNTGNNNNNNDNGTSGGSGSGSGGGGGGNFGGTTQTVILELCNDFLPDGDTDSEDCVEDFSVFFTPYMCANDNPNDIHDWAENNHPQATMMANFLANNYPQDDSNNCVEVDFDEQIVEDLSFEDTDTDCIHNKMKANSNNIYAKMFSNFNGTTGKIPDIKVGATPSGDWGITRSNDTDGNSYTLTIDDNVDTNGSNLMKYVTLCHEMIHAYMWSLLEDEGLINFDASGLPGLTFDCDDNIPNLNAIPLEERFVAVICAMDEAQVNNGQWTHDLFNETVFDIENYRQALEEFLINEHDWDEENQDFKNEAENRFGANWKQEVSRAISWIGLEETSDYLTYRNSYDGFQFLYITTIRSKIANTNKNCQ